MNLQEVLNTIRDNASDVYRERVPEATVDNIESIRIAMINENNIQVANEFISTLLNKLVKSVVHTKLFENPLKSLKQGTKPLGDTIEEIYNNFLKAEAYDPSGTDLMKRKKPDTKTVFHRMNRQDQYTISISREQLSKAFISYDSLESFVSNLINTLYNSAELDEFINIKQILKSALDNNAMITVTIDEPLENEANGKAFIKAVKTISELMAFPSDKYNAYLQAQNVDDKPIITFSRKKEQVLIIDVATNTTVNIDVLASLFNMSVAEFNDTKKIIIDAFPDKNMRAALVDEAFFQVYDDLFTITSFYNGKGLYETFFLNVWQTLAYSILVNAVAFVVAGDKNSDGTISTYSVTHNLIEGVTASNTRKTASEGTSYSVTLRGHENKTVTVTMAGVDITSTSFDSETGKVSIDDVVGDIIITVA